MAAMCAAIEKVIATHTAKHFSRDDFLRALDTFYKASETAAVIQETAHQAPRRS